MESKLRRFGTDFVTDLEMAVDYYDGFSQATGDKFRAEVRSKIDLVASNSEGFAIVHNNIRAVRLRKFPYVLLYRSFDQHVEFLGLVQGSTERRNWFDR